MTRTAGGTKRWGFDAESNPPEWHLSGVNPLDAYVIYTDEGVYLGVVRHKGEMVYHFMATYLHTAQKAVKNAVARLDGSVTP